MTDQIQLEPEAHAFAEAAARSPLLFTLGPEQGRLALDQVQSGTIRKPAVDMQDLTITDGPSAQVALRILRPQKAQSPLPVIVYIHGAGWVFGSTQTHDRLVRELAVGAQAAVVFPVYRLCPEARYPTALEECYTVRSEEHTSELQSRLHLVCRLLLEKKNYRPQQLPRFIPARRLRRPTRLRARTCRR